MPRGTIVHLSTSNSNQRLPKGNWLAVWAVIVALVFGIILFFEFNIRQTGWQPSTLDSKLLWASERTRASEVGENLLLLVGTSRIQLSIDTNYIRKATQFEPVQLAIDGSSYRPVLENVAKDDRIRGTVIVAITARHLKKPSKSTRSSQWVANYENRKKQSQEPFRVINNHIKSIMDSYMVTRVEGAKPITTISALAFKPHSAGNYHTTHADRSRDVDYSKVKMPDFYVSRLKRHFGKSLTEPTATFSKVLLTYQKAINNLEPQNGVNFTSNLASLLELVNRIETRGGRVFLVRFPTDKLIWDIDEAIAPKEIFWKEIASSHPRTIHFLDWPSLSRYNLPDGSHLDKRDKTAFTKALVHIIKKWDD